MVELDDIIEDLNCQSIDLIDKAKINTVSIIRAILVSTPYVGSGLDTLIFGRANDIEAEKVKVILNSFSKKIKSIEEEKLDINWFQTEEALNIFRIMFDRLRYEPEKTKIELLGQMPAIYGIKENVKNTNKAVILDRLSALTNNQLKLLKILKQVNRRERAISNGGLTVNTAGLWLTDIAKEIMNTNRSLIHTYIYDIEILESFNFVRRIIIPITDTEGGGYTLSQIGREAIKYLSEANQTTE